MEAFEVIIIVSIVAIVPIDPGITAISSSSSLNIISVLTNSSSTYSKGCSTVIVSGAFFVLEPEYNFIVSGICRCPFTIYSCICCEFIVEVELRTLDLTITGIRIILSVPSIKSIACTSRIGWLCGLCTYCYKLRF